MSSEFMPMALDSLARQQSARAAGSGASSRITEEELEELGIPADRTYIRYTATTDWGWNGGNF